MTLQEVQIPEPFVKDQRILVEIQYICIGKQLSHLIQKVTVLPAQLYDCVRIAGVSGHRHKEEFCIGLNFLHSLHNMPIKTRKGLLVITPVRQINIRNSTNRMFQIQQVVDTQRNDIGLACVLWIPKIHLFRKGITILLG